MLERMTLREYEMPFFSNPYSTWVAMNAQKAITRSLTPEEAELERKKIELTRVENDLAERELELNTLEAELRAFERVYLRVVGVRYAALDELEAQIREALAQYSPDDKHAQEQASRSREQARESARATNQIRDSGERAEFEPTEDLKKLYREMAKLMHPDLAVNEADRKRRTEFMTAVNAAYQEGNTARLHALLREWQHSPEVVMGDDVAAELIRVIRKIARARERLQTIDYQLGKFRESDLFNLRRKAREAQEQGRDLLHEMADELDERIARVRERLMETRREWGRK